MMSPISRAIASVVIALFGANTLFAPVSYAQVAFLPAAGTMVPMTAKFNPVVIKGVQLYPDNPFKFDFIVDTGDANLDQDQLKAEGQKLIAYFLASLTTPEKDMWVNLSPYEKDRIVPTAFGDTEMGKELLTQDYLLKQIMATALYPERALGKQFWQRIYAQAQAKFGTTNVPVNTFNKVWILPAKAVVYENSRTNAVFVVESSLKVMLEKDYLAAKKNGRQPGDTFRGTCPQAGCQADDGLSARAIREIVIPALEKEVNEGKNFAPLRQVYQSLILAAWYKKNLKDSVIAKAYVDRGKTKGVDVADKDITQKIYQQYLQAYRKGVYNFIKEDIDPATQTVVPRKYFSGGVVFNVDKAMVIFKNDEAMAARLMNTTVLTPPGNFVLISAGADLQGSQTVATKEENPVMRAKRLVDEAQKRHEAVDGQKREAESAYNDRAEKLKELGKQPGLDSPVRQRYIQLRKAEQGALQDWIQRQTEYEALLAEDALAGTKAVKSELERFEQLRQTVLRALVLQSSDPQRVENYLRASWGEFTQERYKEFIDYLFQINSAILELQAYITTSAEQGRFEALKDRLEEKSFKDNIGRFTDSLEELLSVPAAPAAGNVVNLAAEKQKIFYKERMGQWVQWRNRAQDLVPRYTGPRNKQGLPVFNDTYQFFLKKYGLDKAVYEELIAFAGSLSEYMEYRIAQFQAGLDDLEAGVELRDLDKTELKELREAEAGIKKDIQYLEDLRNSRRKSTRRMGMVVATAAAIVLSLGGTNYLNLGKGGTPVAQAQPFVGTVASAVAAPQLIKQASPVVSVPNVSQPQPIVPPQPQIAPAAVLVVAAKDKPVEISFFIKNDSMVYSTNISDQFLSKATQDHKVFIVKKGSKAEVPYHYQQVQTGDKIIIKNWAPALANKKYKVSVNGTAQPDMAMTVNLKAVLAALVLLAPAGMVAYNNMPPYLVPKLTLATLVVAADLQTRVERWFDVKMGVPPALAARKQPRSVVIVPARPRETDPFRNGYYMDFWRPQLPSLGPRTENSDTKGGIDLQKVDVNARGGGVRTAFSDPAQLKMLMDADGLVPVIYNIQPITVPVMNMLLGLNSGNTPTV